MQKRGVDLETSGHNIFCKNIDTTLDHHVDARSDRWNRTNDELKNFTAATLVCINTELFATIKNRYWVFSNAYVRPIIGVNASQNLQSVKDLYSTKSSPYQDSHRVFLGSWHRLFAGT